MAGFRPYQALIRADRMSSPELGASMRRREFIGLVGCVAALPPAARAQQSSKMKRIAMVHPAEKVGNMTINGRPGFRAFFEELNRLGYVEGQNLIVERYSAEGYFSQLARDVVNTHPDVIFVQSNLLVLAFKAATASIPIVATSGDPVIAGIVSSIAHPGENITGVAVDAGFELLGSDLAFSSKQFQNP
jgi:putative tryptophan/tyrosine transport system substrate-binding protein